MDRTIVLVLLVLVLVFLAVFGEAMKAFDRAEKQLQAEEAARRAEREKTSDDVPEGDA